jgi:hypothetical protein
MGGGGLSILFSRQQIRIRSGGVRWQYRGERLQARVPRAKTKFFGAQSKFSRPDETDPKYPRPLDSLQLKNFAKIFSFELRSIIDSWHSNLNAE